MGGPQSSSGVSWCSRSNLNPNHFPGPSNRDTTALRKFLRYSPQPGYRSDNYPRYLLSRTLRQNRLQLIPNFNISVLSVNRIWTCPRVLLVTGPNGKCNQTAEIKKNSTSKRNSPFYSAEQIRGVTDAFQRSLPVC